MHAALTSHRDRDARATACRSWIDVALVCRQRIGCAVQLMLEVVPLIGCAVAEILDAVSVECGFRFRVRRELFDGFEHGDTIDERHTGAPDRARERGDFCGFIAEALGVFHRGFVDAAEQDKPSCDLIVSQRLQSFERNLIRHGASLEQDPEHPFEGVSGHSDRVSRPRTQANPASLAAPLPRPAHEEQTRRQRHRLPKQVCVLFADSGC